MKHHTYLINMDDSPSRLERCATQLQERGVAFTRIPGVDVRKQPELKQQHYSAERNRWHHRSELTDGEIGCTLSHRIAWQQIIDDEIEFGLVLEDDFEIVADLNPVLEVIAGLEFDWHLLKLMEGPVEVVKKRKIKVIQTLDELNLVSYDKPPVCTAAQVVSRAGALKLLEQSTVFFRPIDVDIQWFNLDGLRVHGIKPYPIELSDDHLTSEIDRVGVRKKSSRRRLVKPLNQLRFIARQVRNRLTRQ